MKLHKNSNGFGIAVVLVVTASLALVGLAGWMVWHKRQTASVNSYETCAKAGGATLETFPPQCVKDGKNYAMKVAEPPTVSFQPNQNVMLDKAFTPPTGWKVEETSDNSVRVAGGKNNCSVSGTVVIAADAKKSDAAKFTADQFQKVIDGSKSKGYSVTKVDPAGMGGHSALKFDGGNGAETYDSLEIRVVGQGQKMRQTYAYVVGDGKFGEVRISCNGEDYAGMQMGDDQDDFQLIYDVLPALHFKVL